MDSKGGNFGWKEESKKGIKFHQNISPFYITYIRKTELEQQIQLFFFLEGIQL